MDEETQIYPTMQPAPESGTTARCAQEQNAVPMSSTLRPRCAAEPGRPGKSKPIALGINITMLQPEPKRVCPKEIRNAKTMRGRCEYGAVKR